MRFGMTEQKPHDIGTPRCSFQWSCDKLIGQVDLDFAILYAQKTLYYNLLISFDCIAQGRLLQLVEGINVNIRFTDENFDNIQWARPGSGVQRCLAE